MNNNMKLNLFSAFKSSLAVYVNITRDVLDVLNLNQDYISH